MVYSLSKSLSSWCHTAQDKPYCRQTCRAGFLCWPNACAECTLGSSCRVSAGPQKDLPTLLQSYFVVHGSFPCSCNGKLWSRHRESWSLDHFISVLTASLRSTRSEVRLPSWTSSVVPLRMERSISLPIGKLRWTTRPRSDNDRSNYQRIGTTQVWFQKSLLGCHGRDNRDYLPSSVPDFVAHPFWRWDPMWYPMGYLS